MEEDWPMTRGERIRSMTNEELAEEILECGIDGQIEFCQGREECIGEKEIPEEWCRRCIVEWLENDPAKESEGENDSA